MTKITSIYDDLRRFGIITITKSNAMCLWDSRADLGAWANSFDADVRLVDEYYYEIKKRGFSSSRTP